MRLRWPRSSFAWRPAIVCLHISCWAVTPLDMRPKPRRRARPDADRWGEISVSTDVNAQGTLPDLRF